MPRSRVLLLALLALTLVAVAAYVVGRGAESPRTEPPIPSPTASGPPTPSSSASSNPSASPPTSPSAGQSPTETAPTGACPQRRRTLTVLTFNIHGGLRHDGSGDGSYELGRIAREIEAWKADVVLLQEVDRYRERSGLDDQPLELATRLGYFAAFGANVRRPPVEEGGRRQEYGTLTLSRLPILDSENLALPNEPGLEQRGLLRATIDVAGAPVDVYNTHLQHSSGKVRRTQVRAIKEAIRRRDLPTVLGGDLNAEPDSPALSLLTGWRMRDPWPLVGADEGLTVPAGSPRRRIDFVLHDDAFGAVAGEHLRSAVSDHRAVRVVLDLTAPRGCQPLP